MIRSFRTLLASAPLLGALMFLPVNAHAADSLGDALSRLAPSADPRVIGLAVKAAECAQTQGGVPSDRLAVIDYSKPSSQPRLWVFDTVNRKLLFFMPSGPKSTWSASSSHFIPALTAIASAPAVSP